MITTWTVPAGGSVEVAESFGTMSADDYRVTVSFNVAGGSASGAFTVR
jgi:hypothetical protein